MNTTAPIALVTGASRGIGQAIALMLARQGITVVGTATTEAGADTIRHTLTQAGLTGKGLLLDVCQPEAIEQCIEHITTTLGAPTILVNNAGITRDTLMLRMKEEDWDAVLQTNLTAVFKLCKTALRGMLKSKSGRIINITSVVGITGNAGQANYAAAKAGIIGLTKSLAQEVASRGITVNTVAPGFIDTDMTRTLSTEQKAGILAKIPLARLGLAEEIAAVVSFLASPGASYITGQTIHVNGGMYMG